MRIFKGFSQPQMAEKLNMDVSNYNRRENGQTKITIEQWEKLANILNVPLEEIHEYDENHIFINRDNTSINYQGTNNCIIPESLLESLQKYIVKLEKENDELIRIVKKK